MKRGGYVSVLTCGRFSKAKFVKSHTPLVTGAGVLKMTLSQKKARLAKTKRASELPK